MKDETTISVDHNPSIKTPWGKPTTVWTYAPGVQRVDTIGHGGFKLDRRANKKVHELFRRRGGWYEEDVEWAIVAYFLEAGAGFSADQVAAATRVLKDNFPTEYEAVTGFVVKPEESRVLRERLAKEAGRGKMHILSAWGDWATNVPSGMVGVWARKDGRDGPVGVEEGFYLLLKEHYDSLQGPVRILPDNVPQVSTWEPAGAACPFMARSLLGTVPKEDLKEVLTGADYEEISGG